MLVMLAAVIAVGMSAFTSLKKQPPVTYYYQNAGWQSIALDNRPCPEGPVTPCTITINNTPYQLFFSQSTTDPVKRSALP